MKCEYTVVKLEMKCHGVGSVNYLKAIQKNTVEPIQSSFHE